MEMVFPLALVMFVYSRPVVKYGSLRRRIFDFLNNPMTNLHFLYGLSTVLESGFRVFLSYSRGGITSLSIACCLLVILLAFRSTKTRNVFLILATVLLILFAVGWFGWDFIFQRFEKIRNADGLIDDARLFVWADTFRIIKEFPLTGTGFGTFVDIYQGYRSAPGPFIFNHAHNDYLEISDQWRNNRSRAACLVCLFCFSERDSHLADTTGFLFDTAMAGLSDRHHFHSAAQRDRF